MTSGKRRAGENSCGLRWFQKKSDRGDLLTELSRLYAPLWRPDLSEPRLTVARARVWRGHPLPDAGRLDAAIETIERGGIPCSDLALLLCLCEVLFRYLRAVEAKLEAVMPTWIGQRVTGKPGQGPQHALLETDFERLWRDGARKEGTAWVLAAGETPLPIRHRPRLVAPWVVGVVVTRWLRLKGLTEQMALYATLPLVGVLLVQRVRPADLHHWDTLARFRGGPDTGRQTHPSGPLSGGSPKVAP